MMKTKKDPLDVFFNEEDSSEAAVSNSDIVYISDVIRRIALVVSILILAGSLVIIAVKSGNSSEAEQSDPVRYLSEMGIAGLTSPSGDHAKLSDLINTRGEVIDYMLDESLKISAVDLYERNNDIVGWIKLGDTIINYHVMQSVDNVYYLNHTLDKRRHFDGSLFVDADTPIINTRRPDNTVIYGHNLVNGKKFNYLMNYNTTPRGRDLTVYKENPTLDFATIYCNERNTYKIFGAMFINSDPAHGEVWPYFTKRHFQSQDDFYDFVSKALDRSVFYTDVDFEYGDELMTLSTCHYPLGGTSDRFVVFARRVREGEDPSVDTSVAYINESPLYFDHWYNRRGGSWGGRKWDTSKVKGFDEWYANQ